MMGVAVAVSTSVDVASAVEDSAGAPIPQVDAMACSTIHAPQFTHLLEVELQVLGELPADIETYVLHLRCSETNAHLSLEDSRGNERLRRELSLSREGEEERTRLIALAAAELLMAWNWVPSGGPRASPVATPQSNPQAPVAPQEEERASDHSASGWGLSAGGAVAVRSIGSGPVATGGWMVSGSYRPLPAVALRLLGSWESGSSRREAGVVALTGWGFGAGVDWIGLPLQPVGFRAQLAARAIHVTLSGTPGDEGVVAARLGGWLPDFVFRVGPRFDLGNLSVMLHADVGLAASNLKAHVSGESPVRYGGFWAGGGLDLFWILSTRP